MKLFKLQSAAIRTPSRSAEEGTSRSAGGVGGEGEGNRNRGSCLGKNLSKTLRIHQAALTSAVNQATQQRDAIRTIPGNLEDDLRVLKDIDKIRLNAIAAIQRFL